MKPLPPFLAKWKNALESGSVKKYEALWVKSARQRPDTGYQDTVRLLTGGVNFEVNLGGQRKHSGYLDTPIATELRGFH